MLFLDYFNHAFQFDRFRNFLQLHDIRYHQLLISRVPEVQTSVSVAIILSTCIALFITLCVSAAGAAKSEEKQPQGCRKLGMNTESNLSDEFDKRFAQGWPLCTNDVLAESWRVKSIYIYPVKSCRGVELDHADIVTTGMKYDRQFTFAQLKNLNPTTNTSGKENAASKWEFITQRKFPRLARVKVEMWVPDHSTGVQMLSSDDVEAGGVLIIRFPHRESGWRGKFVRLRAIMTGTVLEKQFRVPFDPAPRQVKKAGYRYEKVTIWKDTVTALNLEPDIPEELRYYLGVSNKLSLFRIDNSALRKVYRCAPKAEELGYQPVTGFQDAYPLHVMNLASLRNFESQLPQTKNTPLLSVTRFRPNIIITGPVPYEEETWKKARIGSYEFAFACRTARCKLPNVDPDSGDVHPSEPDRTLRLHRNVDAGAGKQVGCLGMQVVPIQRESVINVGDEVTPLEYGEHFYLKQ